MSNPKLKLVALSLVLVMICSAIPGSENPAERPDVVRVNQNTPSAEVWSRDFDDGNISDWTIFAIDDGVPYNEYPGNFSAEDGALRAGGDHFNIALFNTSVAYGMWNFDVYVVDQAVDHEIVIPFILVEYNMDRYLMQAYFFQIVTGLYRGDDTPRLAAGKMVLSSSPEGRTVSWFDEYPSDDIWGWKNFIITRDDTNQFYIYMNGSLVLEFNDEVHTTCNHFGFSTRAGPALDNIVVSDTVDYDAAPPRWTPAPTNQFVVLGDDFRYDLNATDFSGVDTWSVNDTTNFAIDSNGVITNALDLAIGTYGLNVSVSDTGGFTKSATFTVTVESPEAPPPPDITLYLILGGGGIVIVALVVLWMRRR
jgi:hypothetical protein